MTWPSAMVDPILDMLHRLHLISDEMESDEHQKRIPVEALATNAPAHRLSEIYSPPIRVWPEQSDGRFSLRIRLVVKSLPENH